MVTYYSRSQNENQINPKCIYIIYKCKYILNIKFKPTTTAVAIGDSVGVVC